MKKVIFAILAIFIFSFIAEARKTPVYAEEIIEEKDVEKLVIDPAKKLPDFELVPQPTPTPPLKGEDRRSWTKSEYKDLIEKTAKKYGVDPQVIYATIMTESEGNKYAFRYEPHIKDASLGVGQVLISTARSLGFEGNPKDLYKPEVGIELIGKYLKKLIETYGELTPLQLATAYNSGSPWKTPTWGHLDRFQMWLEEKG